MKKIEIRGRIPEALAKKFKVEAAGRGIRMSVAVEKAVELFLEVKDLTFVNQEENPEPVVEKYVRN